MYFIHWVICILVVVLPFPSLGTLTGFSCPFSPELGIERERETEIVTTRAQVLSSIGVEGKVGMGKGRLVSQSRKV